jgi:hypothetical protein
MGATYEVHRWDVHRRNYKHTKFHKDWFWHSGNIKVITSTICQLGVFILIVKRIYEVRCWNGFSWSEKLMIFYDNRFRHSCNITVIVSTISQAAVLVLLMEGIYDTCRWTGLRLHDIHIRFHTYRSGIEIMLLRLFPQQFLRMLCWCYQWERVMKYVVEMASCAMRTIPSFIKIRTVFKQ